jgi:uncharacterized membrane protein YpjA
LGTSLYLPKQEEKAMEMMTAFAFVALVSLGLTAVGTWLAIDEQA